MPDDDDEIEAPPLEPADPWPGADVKQRAFLTALVTRAGRRSLAAKDAKISRSNHYRWMETDTNYQVLYAKATNYVVHVLEDEATRRAVDGVTKGIFYMGEKVATERLYSDGLMMFLLRGAAPEKYREKTEHTGAIDLNLRFKGTFTDLLATYRELAMSANSDATG